MSYNVIDFTELLEHIYSEFNDICTQCHLFPCMYSELIANINISEKCTRVHAV